MTDHLEPAIDPTSSDEPNTKPKVYDLEARTTEFAERVIAFAKSVAQNAVTFPLIRQLVRSGTSIGANYSEADDAVSKRDFEHRISICQRESRATKYWLRMMVTADPACRERARPLWKEAKELHLIFSKIRRCTASRRRPK